MQTENFMLKTAYDGYSHFFVKLCEFEECYQLNGRPALIVQASPVARNVEVDVLERGFVQALQHSGSGAENWWNGFESACRPIPTFGGVSLVDSYSGPAWAYEFHRNGHAISGVWTFPSGALSDNKAVMYFFDSYAEVFRDFKEKTVAAIEHAGISGAYDLTAALLNAKKLSYSPPNIVGRVGNAMTPPKQETLVWRVRRVAEPADWDAAIRVMGAELLGAYGDRLRTS